MPSSFGSSCLPTHSAAPVSKTSSAHRSVKHPPAVSWLSNHLVDFTVIRPCFDQIVRKGRNLFCRVKSKYYWSMEVELLSSLCMSGVPQQPTVLPVRKVSRSCYMLRCLPCMYPSSTFDPVGETHLSCFACSHTNHQSPCFCHLAQFLAESTCALLHPDGMLVSTLNLALCV